MALQVWLPLNKDYSNVGVGGHLSASTLGTVSIANDGPIGGCLVAGTEAQTTNGLSFGSNMISELGRHFSCAVWVKPNGNHVHYNGTIISSGNWNTTNGRWAFGVSQDNTKVDVFGPNYNQWVTCSVPVGKWTHLASVFNDGVGTLYKNGELVGTYNFGSAVFSSDTTTFTVGRETYASGYFSFNGRISDLRIYDHCLSSKEIKEISKGLVLHYKLNSGCAVSKNLVNGTITGGSINRGTITVTDGIATINNTSGSWCRVRCQDEAESNTNLANNDVTNKTITVSFDILMISGNVPTIFVSDSYRRVTGVDKTQIGVWQRGYCTYVHPGYSSSYNYFSPHFSSLGNYQIKDIKIVLGDIKDYYSSYNEGSIVYDSSGYGRHGTFTNTLSTCNESPKYDNGVLSENSVITCTNFSLPDGPSTISFWNKPSVSATENTSRMTVRFGKFEYFTYLNYPYFIHDTDYRYKYVNYWLDGNWHFVTCVYDGTNVMIYIDGEQLSLSVTTTTRDYQNNLVITPIGESVSDFRVYSTALSAEDVAELYHTAASIDNHGNFFCGELKEL